MRERDVVEPRVSGLGKKTMQDFKEDKKGQEKSFCFLVVKFELICGHPCFYVVFVWVEFFGEVGHFTERSGFLELCITFIFRSKSHFYLWEARKS